MRSFVVAVLFVWTGMHVYVFWGLLPYPFNDSTIPSQRLIERATAAAIFRPRTGHKTVRRDCHQLKLVLTDARLGAGAEVVSQGGPTG